MLNRKASKQDKEELKNDVKELLDNKGLLTADPSKPSALKVFLLILFPIALIIIAAIVGVILPQESFTYKFFSLVGLTLPTDAAFWLPARNNDLSTQEAFTATTYSTTGASLVAFGVLLLLNMFSGVLPGLF